jgi:hypothetical protein
MPRVYPSAQVGRVAFSPRFAIHQAGEDAMKIVLVSAAAALVASLIFVIGHARGRDAQAASAAAAMAEVRPAPAAVQMDAAAEDRSEIIGQIEPLLVGSPAPRRDAPARAARR